MSLTIKDVQRVAFLSRLQLTSSEEEKFLTQLSNVLEYINTLNELDTSKVEPTIAVTGQTNRMREDEVTPSFTQAEALQNAANKTDQYFIAPYVFE